MVRVLIAFGMVLIGGNLLMAQQSSPNAMSEIAQSHIRANVPPASKFDRILLSDLTAYFSKSYGKTITIRHKMLRDGPTQSGVAYPKFYLWVRIFDKANLRNEGAVRVAAIETKRFEVTDFVPLGKMRKNPDELYSVFPQAVADKIQREYIKR